jgi:hypothetical protein
MNQIHPLPGPSGVQSSHIARGWCRFAFGIGFSDFGISFWVHESPDHEKRTSRLHFGFGKERWVVSIANRGQNVKPKGNRMPPVLHAECAMPDRSGYRPGRRDSGIALVTVLAVTVLVLGLLTLITGLTTRSARITRTDAATSALAQLADGYSDVARVVLTENLRLSRLPAGAWLDLLATNRTGNTPTINPTDPKVVKMAGNHRLESDGVTLGWQIKAVSPKAERGQWVRVAATAQDSSGRSQTVLRRVQFDPNSIFDLAMLTEDVNCMFCHLTVNGDVGSLNMFRPGWGTESAGGSCNIPNSTCGIGSGFGSQIDGSVFVASSFSQDVAASLTGPQVNGTTVTGNKNEKYSGDRLPSNDDTGSPQFPGLDRAVARSSAKGSLSGGESIRGVGLGGNFSGASAVPKIAGTYDGNLVLVGTAQNPIKLSGDIYVSGDVVIKGVVEGQGAIYSGRNVYIAGNLVNKNRADKPGDGVCQGISSPDECARKNIAAGKDELRLSAGNNIIMGDFTESDAAGKPVSRRDRQAADYFREQFGLAYANQVFSTEDRFVRKGSGEELRLVKVTGQPDAYIDQLGNRVKASEVKTITGDAVYENLISPGQTDKDGNFSRWLSDAEYQSLLGKETIDYGIWRSRFRFDDLKDPNKSGVTPERYKNSGNVSQKIADLAKELEEAGFPTNLSNEAATVIITTPGDLPKNPWMKAFDGKTAAGKPVSGTLSFDGSYLRVAMKQAYDYPSEVTQLDAFLYANNRIAGKLAARGGFVNGGLIARELGVLAPGRNGYNAAWLKTLSSEDQKAFNLCDRTARPLDSVDDADNKTPGKCNYAINYDHRLRNGGYGFNLYQGTTGITADWSFDLSGAQKVDLTP